MLASKFFDDVYYNNAYYARVGGISNTEVCFWFLRFFAVSHLRLIQIAVPHLSPPSSIAAFHAYVQVNSLEMEMLRMISFSLFVEPEAYERRAFVS